jgi:hypothetical protein
VPIRILAGATEFVHLRKSSSVHFRGLEERLEYLWVHPVCNDGDSSTKLNPLISDLLIISSLQIMIVLVSVAAVRNRHLIDHVALAHATETIVHPVVIGSSQDVLAAMDISL